MALFLLALLRGRPFCGDYCEEETTMPEKKTIARAKKAKREHQSPSTQAGEFVREEIEHIREGKHGARSTKQAIAIGLSKARRAGVELPAPRNAALCSDAQAGATRPREGAPKAKKSRPSDRARPGAPLKDESTICGLPAGAGAGTRARRRAAAHPPSAAPRRRRARTSVTTRASARRRRERHAGAQEGRASRLGAGFLSRVDQEL